MLIESPEQIQQLAKQLTERSTALRTHFDSIQKAVTDRKAQLEAEQKARLSAAGSAEERHAIRAVMGRDLGRQLSKLRREAIASREDTLDGILQPLDEWEAQLEASEILHQSAPQLLGREGLGDPRRSEIQRQLEHAGDATIRSMADLARAKGDLVLAAAVLAVQDSKPRGKRALDLQEFSNAMVGDRLQAIQSQLAAAREQIRGMRELRKAIDVGTESSHEKIKAGLAAHQARQRQTDPDAIARARRSS